MQAKKYTPNGNSDKERLLDAMKQLQDGVFNPVDEGAFEDIELAEGFNQMLEGIVGRNNRLVMRLNDAQIRIADNTSIRNLINGVNSRKEPLKRIQHVTTELMSSLNKNSESQIEIMSLTKQAHSTVEPAIIELEKANEAFEKGDFEAAKLSYAHVNALLQDVVRQLGYIKQKAVSEYSEEDENRSAFETLEEDVEFLANSIEDFSELCYMNGQRMYRISRDIDSARNDMFRQNSRVSLIDRTKIYSVDHLTVVWRLYNHTLEYETLKITQVNNSDTCKFGLWCESLDIPEIKESDEFKTAVADHLELHDHAIACFVAKEASDKAEALKEFEILIECWKKFDASLAELAKFMAENGYDEETEVWKFE